ncbi:ABC transporter substrate-binding protein [Tengunoibacter tsumagoiensis]|uniref:Sugar ABC transporter substrate-binding protein n=1 Tax=Tengunoibacter tsumagoiensis TaxID=2014871 RepID=A0A402A766_9CHLR|nr:sugar ABC transporter substrate-binding protein [Tengunoibacter tsumagoiensis]GCE14885.1 sugar ABC transporter substrate-binding protein [Tengunoibacter tsumagoiensis]
MTRISRPHFRLAFAICALLSTLLLAACGGTSPASSDHVTLTFGWWSNGPQHDQEFAKWAESFTKTHPNITIKSEFLPFGDYFTKLQTTAAAGKAYDVIGQCSCNVAPYYANQQMVDLSTFSDFKASTSDIDPGAVQTDTYNGHPYGMPLGVAARVIGYNKALFAAAGIAEPDPTKPLTLSEFTQLAKKLTVVSNGKMTQAGLFTGLDQDASYLPEFFAENQGVSLFDNYVNPQKVTINSPAGIKALTDYQALWKQNIEPSIDDNSWQAGLAGLQSNRVAMTISGPWEFSQFDTSKYGVMPIPVSDAGKHMQRMTINSLSIYSGSQHKAEAWEFLKWAAQAPQQQQYAAFADTPVNKTAFANSNTIIKPASFYPTLQVEATNIRPYLLSSKTQLTTTITNILQDLIRGKISPTDAASQLEQQGNSVLAGN